MALVKRLLIKPRSGSDIFISIGGFRVNTSKNVLESIHTVNYYGERSLQVDLVGQYIDLWQRATQANHGTK